MSLHDHSFPDEYKHILWKEAVQVAEREDCRYRYVLYQLRNLYIEIKYHRLGSIRESLKIFSNPWQLQPYLNSIDLGNLDIKND